MIKEKPIHSGIAAWLNNTAWHNHVAKPPGLPAIGAIIKKKGRSP